MTSHLLTSIIRKFCTFESPNFLYPFLKELLKGSWKLKNFFQHLKYELSYDILNLDKFEAQKPDTPPPPRCKIRPNLRVLLSSRPKKIHNCEKTWKTVLWRHNLSRDNFFCLFKLVFMSQKRKIKVCGTGKPAYLAKNCEKNIIGIVF